MKAMVVPKWGERSVLMTRPDPKPGPREAVMRVRAAGVGLTLLNMRNGSFGGEAPRIMGHELGGDIVEVGSDVTELKAGDRCAVYFYLTCHRCRWCRGGRETLCEAFKGFVGVHRDGGYAEYVSLPVENFRGPEWKTGARLWPYNRISAIKFSRGCTGSGEAVNPDFPNFREE